MTRAGGDLTTRDDVRLALKRYWRDMPSAQRNGLRRMTLRQRWQWLWRVRRLERRLDSPEVRGEGLNLRWFGVLDKLNEAFEALEKVPRR